LLRRRVPVQPGKASRADFERLQHSRREVSQKNSKNGSFETLLPPSMITPERTPIGLESQALESVDPATWSGKARSLEQRLQAIGLVEGDQRVFNGDPPFFAELAQCAGYGFAGGAGH